MSPEAQATEPQTQAPRNQKVMSFLEHLEELRSTLFFVLGVGVIGTFGAWFVSRRILDTLVTSALDRVYFSSPPEGFLIRLKVSAVTGILVALPFMIARLWSFVAPGLFQHEKRVVVPVLVSGAMLFYLGVLFSYLTVVPKMVEFFLSFAGDRLAPLINVTQYFVFVAKFCLAFGIAFQMPLVTVLLTSLGLVTPERLWSVWRYGVILIFVAAAWLTPPDGLSQIMMGLPLVVLYLLSLGLSFLFARRRRKS